MRVKILVCFLIAFSCIWIHPFQPLALERHSFNEIEQAVAGEVIEEGGLIGISIRSAKTGELLYDYNGNTRLRPASNLKLLTAASALETLGKDYTFETKLLTDGKRKWNVLHGNLYLKGGGDPTLQLSHIQKFAKETKKQGIRFITGDIIGDDTRYDDVRYSLDLPWSDETFYYGAPVSALSIAATDTYDTATVLLTVVPDTELGKRAKVEMIPETTYVKIKNNTQTVEPTIEDAIEIERTHGTNEVVVNGTIPLDAPQYDKKIAIWEPTNYTIHLMKEALHKEGITLIGDGIKGKTPDEATLLVSHQSKPLSEIIIPFMKESLNGYGEMFVKEMGYLFEEEGSWDNGLKVMKETLSHLGLNEDDFVLRDGSGISHVNLISANELSKLLFTVQQKEWFSAYAASLPVAGSSDKFEAGTLRGRLSHPLFKGKIRAKTGTISTVSSLSGYYLEKDLIFSIIINNVPETTEAKKIEDNILELLLNN